jgi:hypothetical protein
VPASARHRNDRAASASSGLFTLRQDRQTTASKPNTSARGSAVVCSNAARIFARSFATRAHAAHVAKPSLTRSAVAAAEQRCTRLCHAVLNHHLADTPVSVRKHAATLKCRTTATKTTRLVPNAPFLWRSGACAGRRRSRTNSVGCRTSVAAMYVAISSVVGHTSVASLVTDRESAKTRTARPVSSSVASLRKRVGIPTRTCAMPPSPARKRSHARVRSSLLVTARRRSKK